ncbi:MAG: SDR family oxidoreductase [Ornithinimicrobium sp.]|uniref:SDR family oxidoreductase n=1 Tax=Ornithinimicrobium sp. TaxID=1977084 RepID=UPI003D9B698A
MSETGVVLVTGVGRLRGIGAAIARGLAQDGWDLALSYWHEYDDRLGYPHGDDDPLRLAEELRALGVRVELIPGDLADPEVPEQLVHAVRERLGEVTALVMSHCESVDSGILDTTVDSFDRHYAVNVRASWLLIAAFAPAERPGGPVVALTSDHTTYNLPYGATKGALDRLVIAACHELGDAHIRANLINPGPIDTGWMTDGIRASGMAATPGGRLAGPETTADLIRFLLSERGRWINGQLLYSNGGFRTPAGCPTRAHPVNESDISCICSISAC